MNPQLQESAAIASRRRWMCSAAMMACGVVYTTRVWSAVQLVGSARERRALQVRAPSKTVLLAAAVAGSSIVAVGERGIVIRSEDDGVNWTQVATPTSVTLTSVLFLDTKRGLAAGHGGIIMQTLDGGHSWQSRIDGNVIARLMLDDAKRRGDLTAIQTAQRLVVEGADKPLLTMERLAGDRIIAAGAYGIVVISDDGGGSWRLPANPIDNPKGLHIYAARTQGQRVVMAGEQGLLLISDDAGERFRAVTAPYRGTFFTADILPTGTIGIAGLRANAFTSDDGGQSWQRRDVPGSATINHSALINSTWFLANQSGQVMRLEAAGFVPVLKAPLAPINALLPLRSGAVIVLTAAGVVRVPSIGDTQAAKQ